MGSLTSELWRPRLIYGLILVATSAFAWGSLFVTWASLKKKLKNRKLFYERHNCVVMYDKKQGAKGWPNYEMKISKKRLTYLEAYDSILYFINTAHKSLDIAFMVIDVDTLVNALIKAQKRGVVVRVLLDHFYNRRGKAKELEKFGIKAVFYVCPTQGVASIMHYKYILKDYTDDDGYVMMGSINWTAGSFQTNYENNFFTTDRSVITAVHKNFEEAWHIINNLSKHNLYVKAKLRGIE